MNLALIQTDTRWESPASNLEKAAMLIAQASAKGATTVALPEMFNTGFSMRAHSIGEIKELTSGLAAIARDNSTGLIAGVAAPSDISGKGLNKALAFDASGTLIAEYAKMHPFSFAGEDKHYEPGRGPVTFDLSGVDSSVFICYDLRFAFPRFSVLWRVT
jgi:predicted amidohydrolase